MRRIRSILGSLYRAILRPIARLVLDLLGLVPALIAGAGVFLIAAGLFYYLQPGTLAPSATPTNAPSSSVAVYSIPPIATAGPPGPSASFVPSIATRVSIPALSIDLPIVTSPPNEQFPLCNAAEYLVLDKALAYPGSPAATYLYAHARTKMFLPLLTQSMVKNGAAMIGMWVEIYTDDDQRHIYQITKVLRHVSGSAALATAAGATTDQLWLQTSEGPFESSTKLQVVAQPVGVIAASQADAHPTGKGNVCPDAPRCKTAGATGCRP
jgi:hypothetical protein